MMDRKPSEVPDRRRKPRARPTVVIVLVLVFAACSGYTPEQVQHLIDTVIIALTAWAALSGGSNSDQVAA